jgi:hypothetical protein
MFEAVSRSEASPRIVVFPAPIEPVMTKSFMWCGIARVWTIGQSRLFGERRPGLLSSDVLATAR